VAGNDLGYASPAPAAGPPARVRRVPFWRELAFLLLLAAGLTVVVKTFAVEAFRIPSGSMEDTLRAGDRVLVNKLVFRVRGIDRGDVVVFSGQGSWDPPPPRPSAPVPAAVRRVLGLTGMMSSGTDYVKRVIGLPGDRVSCCDTRGRITVDGMPLNERSYLYPGNQPSAQRFSVTVPPGRLWVMGDHRLNSSDSRYHGDDPGDGTIPEDAVIGRVFLVVWPPAQLREVPIPAAFAQPALAVPPGRGPARLPMGLGLAGMLPLAWACRRQSAHVTTDRR
jgi:signal peptidase I